MGHIPLSQRLVENCQRPTLGSSLKTQSLFVSVVASVLGFIMTILFHSVFAKFSRKQSLYGTQETGQEVAEIVIMNGSLTSLDDSEVIRILWKECGLSVDTIKRDIENDCIRVKLEK